MEALRDDMGQARCPSCKAEVIEAFTPAGQPMLVDPRPRYGGTLAVKRLTSSTSVAREVKQEPQLIRHVAHACPGVT